MAVSSTSLPQLLSPLNNRTTPNLSSLLISPPFLKPSNSSTTRSRRNSFVAAASNPKEAISNQDKRELLERYGLDPNDFLSEPSPKRKRRREGEQRVGRGKLVQNEDQKLPRTTHKLLQEDDCKFFAWYDKKEYGPRAIELISRLNAENDVLKEEFGRLRYVSNKVVLKHDVEDNGAKKNTSAEEIRAMELRYVKMQEKKKLMFGMVLAGTAKRKKLLSPVGIDVRPMMEVVKGAAFGILQVAGGCPASLRPGRWLDLYSGTGSVGIEAVSRGCSEVHFVEMDPWVVSNVLHPNLQWTDFLNVSVIHTVRVETFLEQAHQFVGTGVTFDYISVTPPYMEVDYGLLMGQISKSSILGEDSFIVVEYPLGTNMLDCCGCLNKIADRRFGRTHLAIYGPNWAQKKRK